MAYDETFFKLPRFSERELYEIPEEANGEMRLIDGVLDLRRIETSPRVQEWISGRIEEGEAPILRVNHNFLKNGEMHSVAWIGRVGVGHQVVCECVPEEETEISSYDYRLFSCEAVAAAINYQANQARRVLNNDEYLHRHGDYETIKGMVQFLLIYSEVHPDTWLVAHKDKVGLVGGFAQAFRRPYDEVREMIQQMQKENLISLSGPDDQVVSLPHAA